MSLLKSRLRVYIITFWVIFMICLVLLNYKVLYLLDQHLDNYEFTLFGLKIYYVERTDEFYKSGLYEDNMIIICLAVSLIAALIISLVAIIIKSIRLKLGYKTFQDSFVKSTNVEVIEGRFTMQKCNVCSKKFLWRQVLKSIWFGPRVIKCHNCQTKYKISYISKLLWSIISLGPCIFLTMYILQSSFWETLTENWSFTARFIFGHVPFILWILNTQIFLPYIMRFKKINKL